MDQEDVNRFYQSIEEFNIIKPIGSIHENITRKRKFGSSTSKDGNLVNIICHCSNPNHFHLLLEEAVDEGIRKFMHRLGTGYTNYFNTKYSRSGSLFQGRYKSIHIDSNPYLLYLSVYVNLNDRIHYFGSSTPKVVRSSWGEYMGEVKDGICEKGIILDQFKDIEAYNKFALSSLESIRERKDLQKYLLE